MIKEFTAVHEGYRITASYDTVSSKMTTVVTDRLEGDVLDKRYISRDDKEALNNKIHVKIGQWHAKEKGQSEKDKFGGIKTGRKHKAAAPSKAEKQAKKEVEDLQKQAKSEKAWYDRYGVYERHLDENTIILTGDHYHDRATNDFVMNRHIKMYLKTHRIVSHAFTGGAPNQYSVIMERK